MDQMKLTRKDLVSFLGSISKVSEVLSRKRPLSITMIRRIYEGLGIPAGILVGVAENKVVYGTQRKSKPHKIHRHTTTR